MAYKLLMTVPSSFFFFPFKAVGFLPSCAELLRLHEAYIQILYLRLWSANLRRNEIVQIKVGERNDLLLSDGASSVGPGYYYSYITIGLRLCKERKSSSCSVL